MNWWWEYFDNRGTDAYMSRVRMISDKMLTAGKGALKRATVTVSDSSLINYSVQCGNAVFVYLYNPSNTDKSASIKIDSFKKGDYEWMVYDCTSGKMNKGMWSQQNNRNKNSREDVVPKKSDFILIITPKNKSRRS